MTPRPSTAREPLEAKAAGPRLSRHCCGGTTWPAEWLGTNGMPSNTRDRQMSTSVPQQHRPRRSRDRAPAGARSFVHPWASGRERQCPTESMVTIPSGSRRATTT